MSLQHIFIVILGIISFATGGYHPGFSFEINEEYQPLKETGDTSHPCPCENQLLCMPLENAKDRNPSAPHVLEFIKKAQKMEVFAFVLECNASVWGKFNWSKLSTIALVGFYKSDLVCHAHQHGVRVVKIGNFPKSDLPNATARHKWVELQANDVASKYLDGINIDYEDAIGPNSPEQEGLTNLVRETAEIFHKNLPRSQNGTCFIKEIPFRGANCSNAAGKQYPYSYMIKTRHQFRAHYHWDKNSLTPWYNIKDNGQQHQIRYDDERSLVYKYSLALMTGMRGIGMWTANFLDYSEKPNAVFHRELMWSLLP